MRAQPALAVLLLFPGLVAALGCRRDGALPPLPVTVQAPAAAEDKSMDSLSRGDSGAAPQRAAPAANQPPAKLTALETMAGSRKLIRTGQVVIEVVSYRKAAQELTRLVESLGGYVADTRATRSPSGREQGTLTLRIPAERFTESLSGLKGLGTVRTEKVNAQDVTKAYADLETRLRVKRDTAERLREILKTRTAGLADVLQAERELARVTEEIEQLEGERRFYDQQVALSTLTVELLEPESVVETGALRPLRQAFDDALLVLAASVAALIYASVFLAPWLLVAWVGWRVVKAVRRRRQPAAAAPGPPAA